MTFGKLYTFEVSVLSHCCSPSSWTSVADVSGFQGNSRSTAILAVAKAYDIDLEVVETVPEKGVPTEYLKINPLGKVPSFEGSDGYILTEAIAIAIYSMCYPPLSEPIGYAIFPPSSAVMKKFSIFQLSLSETMLCGPHFFTSEL